MNLPPQSGSRRAIALTCAVSCLFLLTMPLSTCFAQIHILEPTTDFTARLTSGETVLVGSDFGAEEGTAWRSGFLLIKEGTSDRAVLEYDLRGLPPANAVTLNLELENMDVPNFTTIFMYSFEGNGLANGADYFRTDSLVTTFTDNGLADNGIPFSFDLTSIYNQAIANGDDYLGILFKNTTAEAKFARYEIVSQRGGSPPTLTVIVPEPGLSSLTWAVALFLCHRRAVFRSQP